MRWAVMIFVLAIAGASRCATPPGSNAPAGKPGDEVRFRGVLDEDVDCRLLRADNGRIYSLSVRLPRWRNGDRICVRGTLTQATGCLRSPTIEVSDVYPAEDCP